MRPRLIFFLLLMLGLATAVRAQSVHWEATDEPGYIALTFENCAPDGTPTIPPVAGVQFDYTGQSSRTEIVNFRTSNSVQLTYRLRARSAAPVSIPAFEVKTNQGTQRVPAFTAGAVRSPALDGAAVSRLAPTGITLWAGEIFPLTYTLDILRRNFNQLASNPDWNGAPLVVEDWSKPDGAEVVVNGEPRINIVYKSRAYAKTPGTVALNSATQLVNLQTGSTGFGLFQMPRVEQISVESNRPQLTVRALPAPPAGFSGAVGQFTLVSKIVPENAAVGEPVTWTLELSGTGNWPDFAGLPSREVSNDFQVVQPRAKRTPAEGKLFDVTLAEDVVLVPTKAGSYALGPINFVYFDPKAGAYKTLSAARTMVTVTAASAPKPSALALTGNVGNSTPETGKTDATDSSSAAFRNPASPTPPAGIPRDPLPGTAPAPAPLGRDTLLLCLLSPVACLLLFWFWLALRSAQRTDPARPRREARARLAATLKQLGHAQPALHPQLLLAWQRDTAALWQLSHAAPRATALSDAAWATLWTEAERTLYGAKTALPADWIARAEAALAAKRVPGFQPLRLFLPRNLLPFAAVLVVSVFSFQFFSASAFAAEPAAAYRSGDFASAEKSWRDTLAKTPTDWIARHNLSLALAQQDRAGEAAEQAAAAFVQNPTDTSVRWHFALISGKAGFAPAPLAAFLSSDPLPSLARLASPAMWQRILIAATVLAALALGWMLANSYGAGSRLAAMGAAAGLAVSVLIAATAIFGVLAYGIAADETAVVAWRTGTLRSIPTEADTTQKTTSLPAGSVARVDKTFLGDRWQRLVFENGQTGWVRKEDIVSLWK